MTVPDTMISRVARQVHIPLIVGGGIRDGRTAQAKLRAGADIIVTGNLLQQPGGTETMKEIAAVVAQQSGGRATPRSHR
jgi:heptaprenylglyceryl phosphate synthase